MRITSSLFGRLLPAAALVTSACAGGTPAPAQCVEPALAMPKPALPTPPGPTAEEAKVWVDGGEKELHELWTDANYAAWVMNTHITDDTERVASKANERVLGRTAAAIQESARYLGLELDPETARKIQLLKVSSPMIAPRDKARRARMTELASKLESMYGKGKYCTKGKGGQEVCKTLGELSKIVSESRKYDELLEAWQGWRTISRPMRPLYAELVELMNEGAKDVGFSDSGELWKSGYDMSAAEFEAETERLWQQVKPLYEQVHCYVRAKLAKHYGKDKVPEDGKIPAHLLGNMWSQEWMNVYNLVEPYKTKADLDVTAALKRSKVDEKGMVKMAEKFFTSLGLKSLPDSFWTNSMFVKPDGREAVCHASAWDVNYGGDIRIKMCIKIDEEDLITIHHELGHDYYFMYYNTRPLLHQAGAHDGFHEAIGDAIALSVTPGYLKEIGLLKSVPKNDQALINLQMKEALDKIAFLPFGKLIDQWRWDVFAGKVKPEQYNEAWWKLREQYQGIAAPVARGPEDFDPGAKFHIPASVPYTRYFLARILQFQFHAAMCKAAGHTGPLHECSIYGNRAAGERLEAMLALGSSQPWPVAMEALTGSRQMDASALLSYFEPLSKWLEKENTGRKCGW